MVFSFDAVQKDMERIDNVRMSQVTSYGFMIDIVTCDESDGKCVAVQEWIPWVDGKVCGNIEEVSEALAVMSGVCGVELQL